jgi:hypothetical protein
LLGALLWTSSASASGWRFFFAHENDAGVATDRHYTSGLFLGAISPPRLLDADASDQAAWLSLFWQRPAKSRFGLTVGQEIFTPTSHRQALSTDDRPYAGWLYLNVAIYLQPPDTESGARPELDFLDSLEVDVGVVGPASQAESLQSGIHDWVSRWPEFLGWEHQLKNEIGFTLRASRRWRLPSNSIPFLGLEYDVIPHLEAEAGTVSTAANVGGMLRIGFALPKDFGRQRIADSDLTGSSFYGYAGAEGSWVIRNIFLDGNTYRSSHDVAKEPLVGRFSAGIAFSYGSLHGGLAFVFSSKEFKKQEEGDGYARLTLGFDY